MIWTCRWILWFPEASLSTNSYLRSFMEDRRVDIGRRRRQKGFRWREKGSRSSCLSNKDCLAREMLSKIRLWTSCVLSKMSLLRLHWRIRASKVRDQWWLSSRCPLRARTSSLISKVISWYTWTNQVMRKIGEIVESRVMVLFKLKNNPIFPHRLKTKLLSSIWPSQISSTNLKHFNQTWKKSWRK